MTLNPSLSLRCAYAMRCKHLIYYGYELGYE